MGSCVSSPDVQKMCGSDCCKGHGHLSERVEECPICYHVPSQNIPLSCGHNIHSQCLTTWWGRGTTNGLVCPMCHHHTYDCFLELSTTGNKPVGYFRQDTSEDHALLLRKKNYTEPTKVVRLTEDARDMGLTAFLFILAEESPDLKNKLQDVLSENTTPTSTSC